MSQVNPRIRNMKSSTVSILSNITNENLPESITSASKHRVTMQSPGGSIRTHEAVPVDIDVIMQKYLKDFDKKILDVKTEHDKDIREMSIAMLDRYMDQQDLNDRRLYAYHFASIGAIQDDSYMARLRRQMISRERAVDGILKLRDFWEEKSHAQAKQLAEQNDQLEVARTRQIDNLFYIDDLEEEVDHLKQENGDYEEQADDLKHENGKMKSTIHKLRKANSS